MNNDLISREALKNILLDSRPDETQYDITFLTGDIKVSLEFILKIIDNAPAVELTKPQGEWIYSHISSGYFCDKCGSYSRDKTNFCSKCGTMMQKGGAE